MISDRWRKLTWECTPEVTRLQSRFLLKQQKLLPPHWTVSILLLLPMDNALPWLKINPETVFGDFTNRTVPQHSSPISPRPPTIPLTSSSFGHGAGHVFGQRHQVAHPGGVPPVPEGELFTQWWGVQVCSPAKELPSGKREGHCLLWLTQGRRRARLRHFWQLLG